MRPLNEILQSLRDSYSYTEQEIDALSQTLDQITELSYIAYRKQKGLSDNS